MNSDEGNMPILAQYAVTHETEIDARHDLVRHFVRLVLYIEPLRCVLEYHHLLGRNLLPLAISAGELPLLALWLLLLLGSLRATRTEHQRHEN